MSNIESTIHWRPWSIAVVLALFISLYALNQFNIFSLNGTTLTGCGILALSVSWNIYVIKLAHSRSKIGWHGPTADGLLLMGLIFVFLGAFF